jgi:apolipoprotein N-acyltransferase
LKSLRSNISYRNLFLTVTSGILLFLSFPKYGIGVIAWAALVPLLFALKDAGAKEGFILGFVTGIVSNIGIMYWITFVVVHYGYLPYYLGVIIMLLLAAYLSVYAALFAAGLVYFTGKGIPRIIAAPVLWTCLEYGKSHLFTGFPWENLAHSQYLYRALIQVVDITGTFGITFLIVVVNVIIFDALSSKFNGKLIWGEIAIGCSLILIVAGYGYMRTHQIEEAEKTAEAIDIAIIQGNIDQNIKWNPRFQYETISAYKYLSLQKQSSRSGLTVWPETAAPFFFQDENNRMHGEITNIAQTSGEWLLFGSPSYIKECDGDEDCILFLNSAFLLSPQGKISGQYNKVHLVPYGEFVPLRKLFPFINKLVVGVGDFRSGKGYYPLTMNNHKLGILICYEGIFPEAGRTYKKMGADLLVNITNDAWFGNTSAPYQHLSMTVFRAIESRLYVVRSANTGISAVIDPTGRIVSKTELFTRTALRDKVKFINYETFYATYGDIFILICMISLLCCVLITFKRRTGHGWRNS